MDHLENHISSLYRQALETYLDQAGVRVLNGPVLVTGDGDVGGDFRPYCP